MLTIQISVAKSTSIRSFISLKIVSAFKGSIVFSKKEFRDNSVAVLKDIAAAFIGMVASAWVTMTLDKTLRSARPGKIRSAVRKKKKKKGVKQREFQLSIVIKRTLSRLLRSPFHFCAVTSPTSMTPNAVHIFVARGRQLHRSLVVPPYIHVYKSICVEGVCFMVTMKLWPNTNSLASMIVVKERRKIARPTREEEDEHTKQQEEKK